jgi:hypothetical protein
MKGENHAYTPELSDQHSCTLRRIAWALGLPMTKAIEAVFDYVGKVIDNHKVCASAEMKRAARIVYSIGIKLKKET